MRSSSRRRGQAAVVARGTLALRAALCLLGVLPGTSTVLAQNWSGSSNAVTITETRVEQLSNAVRIFIKADGTLQCDATPRDFWEVRDDQWELAWLKRFNIALLNARSGIGHYVDVDRYPVSHVTLSVPTDAREGVGLAVSLVLYEPGRIGKFQRRTDSVRDWGWWMGGIRVDMLLSDNKQELILTVHTEEHRDEPTGEAKATELPSTLRLYGAGERWRLQAIRAPFADVVGKVADAAGTSVTLDPGVDRRITANLPAMGALEMLQALCDTACLELTNSERGYYITTGTSDNVGSYWAGSGRRIILRNMPVDDALRCLPGFVLRHLKADAEGNAVIAYGPPQLLDKVERDLVELDRVSYQMRVTVLVAQLRNPKEAWKSLAALFQRGTTSVGLEPVSGAIQVGVVDQSLRRMKLELQRLERAGIAEVRVEPDVTVLNGEQARVFIGKQQFYQFMRPTWYGVEPELRRVDVGVRLISSPWSGDGRIITVPFLVASDLIVGETDDGLPIVSRQQAQGNLRVTDQDCIVFGGLRTQDRFTQRLGFPPLKDGITIGGPLRFEIQATTDEEILLCVGAETVPVKP